MKIKWKFQPKGNVSAKIAASCIEDIARANHGQVTAAMLVKKARKKTYPLHSCFEWNDKSAGNKYRLIQAQQIIVQITISKEVPSSDEPIDVRRFLSVEENGSKFYTPMERALSIAGLRMQILNQALSELKAFRQKYADLKELVEIFTLIPKIEKKVKGRKSRKRK